MSTLIEKLNNITKIEKDYRLDRLTTFRIGGPAKYFCETNTIDKLHAVLEIARDNNLPTFVIGGGSNLLISDNGFDGLVIKLNFNILEIDNANVRVSADIVLNSLVDKLVDNSLTGIEGLAGIPGTVGGAIAGNAGAYGDEIGSVVVEVEALDKDYNLVMLQPDELNFKYRHSIFKDKSMIILLAKLKFTFGDKREITDKVEECRKDRTDKHPPFPSAGCTFKNIELTDSLQLSLKRLGIELPEKFIEYKKVPVAWLLDQLNLKGKQIGGAQISEKHGNFIINKDHATANDVVSLISYIKQQVKDRVGVQLQEEVRYIGF